MFRTRNLACIVGLFVGVSQAPASLGAPVEEPPLDPNEEVIEEPVEPPLPCASDASGAVVAVREIFADLAGLYRERLPGPAGIAYLEQRSEKLIEDLADADAFTEAILRGLHEEMTPEEGPAWTQLLGVLLRQRLRRRIQDPRGHTLAIGEASVSCHHARVDLALRSNNTSRGTAKVALRLVLRREGWRIYDMAVQGISLVHTWRNRLHRIRREEGLQGMHRQLALMQRRLGVKGPAEALPSE